MSPILIPQGVVFATAMAAFSGTVILLAFKIQKSTFSLSSSSSHFQVNPHRILRPCLSSGERKEEKKKKKRVRFAEDVVDPTGNSEVFRRQHHSFNGGHNQEENSSRKSQNRGMPANRVALYNGILRDRVIHRRAFTY